MMKMASQDVDPKRIAAIEERLHNLESFITGQGDPTLAAMQMRRDASTPMKLVNPEPAFYCVDREAGVTHECTLQCNGCSELEQL